VARAFVAGARLVVHVICPDRLPDIGALTVYWRHDAFAHGNRHRQRDTRTINLFTSYSGIDSATYLVNGQYDRRVATAQLFLRDWRRDNHEMDPRLFDWCGRYRAAGGARSSRLSPPIVRLRPMRCAARSRAVANIPAHAGRRWTRRCPNAMSRIASLGCECSGGVGYYPTAAFRASRLGSVRAWPRMSYEQLAQLFRRQDCPPSEQRQPLARYEEAKAEIEAPTMAYRHAPRRSSAVS